MKLFITAIALVVAIPAAAQTAPAAQPPAQQHQDHQQHGQMQHGQAQGGQHQGHAMGDCCADRNGNGRMDCCENMAQGTRQPAPQPQPNR